MSSPAPASRKRKLPSSLGLVPGGRPHVPAATPLSPPPSSARKRQATEARVQQRSPQSVQAVNSDARLAGQLHLSVPAAARSTVDLRSPSPSSSPPALIPLHQIEPLEPAEPAASRIPAASSATASASAASILRLHFTGSSAAAAAGVNVLPSSASSSRLSLPRAYDPSLAGRVFPLLQLPSDVLSLLTPYLTPWDAFFARCSCSALRLVSGLNGGVTGPPIVLAQQQRQHSQTKRGASAKRKSFAAARSLSSDRSQPAASASIDLTSPPPSQLSAAAADSVSASSGNAADAAPALSAVASTDLDAEWSDEFRLWHSYNSLDFRQLLCGWREFDRLRAQWAARSSASNSCSHSGGDVVELASDDDEAAARSLESPPPNSIVIFDSSDDEEKDAGAVAPGSGSNGRAAVSLVSSASSSASAAASTSPQSPLWRIDIYERMQRALAPFLFGFPRIRPSALVAASRSSSGSGAAEDLSTSSEDDLWLLHFLRSHRFPAVKHFHFAYATLHSPLLQHLQAYCSGSGSNAGYELGVSSSASDAASSVASALDISVQYSDKSVGRWMDSLWRDFGPLASLALDLTPCQKASLWPSVIAPLLPSAAGAMRELQLLGPVLSSVSLPGNILDVLSATLPALRSVWIAHGLATTQSDLLKACNAIRTNKRWRQLRSISLLHFPRIESLYPLLDAFESSTALTAFHVLNCVNVRLPVVEAVKKPVVAGPAAAATSGAKGKKRASTARSDSPPPAKVAAAKPLGEDVLPLSLLPRLEGVTSFTLSSCPSLTVPSLRSISFAFPRLETLKLERFDSNTLGGTALKVLMDPSLFPRMTSLHLAHCTHLDDHALEALPKKTRMGSLRELSLSLGRGYSAARGNGGGSGSGSGGRSNAHLLAAPVIEKGKLGVGGRIVPVEAKHRLTDHGLNMLLVYCPALTSLNLSGQCFLSPAGTLRIFSRLAYIERVTLTHMSLDASWLHSLVRLPIAHAFTVRISLSLALLHSASALLPSLAPAASAATSSSAALSAASPAPPSRLPATFTANSVNGAILRSKVAAQLEQRVAELTQGRITLRVAT